MLRRAYAWVECVPSQNAQAGRLARHLLAGVGAAYLGACSVPSVNQPARYGEDLKNINLAVESFSPEELNNFSAVDRNKFITARMYAIDQAYTEYEAKLTHEQQLLSFGTAAASTLLNTAGALVPSAATTRVLSGVAGAVTAVGTEYNEKVLIAKAIQNIQTQMRADRSDQAAKIYASMKCKVGAYPVGMALSDLEGYYRAGTFTSGLIGLSKTVGKEEAQAKADKNAQSPGGATAKDVQALSAVSSKDAVEAKTPSISAKYMCPIDSEVAVLARVNTLSVTATGPGLKPRGEAKTRNGSADRAL
jgi:hypothetical protein